MKTNPTIFLYHVSKEIFMEMSTQGSNLYASNRSGNKII